MTLKEWRAKNKLSQATIANHLSEFAGRDLAPRTVGYWELGSVPRRFWLEAVREFTGGKVTPNDFVPPSGK